MFLGYQHSESAGGVAAELAASHLHTAYPSMEGWADKAHLLGIGAIYEPGSDSGPIL